MSSQAGTVPLKVAAAPLLGLLIVVAAIADGNAPFVLVGLCVTAFGCWAWVRRERF